MGLFDTLINIGGALLEDAVKNMEQRQKVANKKLKQYEKKISDLDSKKNMMSTEQLEKLKKAKDALNKAKSSLGNKTIEEWDREWKCIGPLKTANLTPYNHCVGLYRHVVRGKTMYVGRAIELNNGGFRKRLSDYRRDSDSARKHSSGKTINSHLDEITTYILVVGNTEEAVEITKRLEHLFIAKYNYPEWNVQLKSRK